MQGVAEAVFTNRAIGRSERLRDHLPAIDTLTSGLFVRSDTPKEVNLETLDIEKF